MDLGAERDPIGTEKDSQKIAVEIKIFLSLSPMRDLQEAVGKYDIYRTVLLELESERWLYLAIPQRVYESLFQNALVS